MQAILGLADAKDNKKGKKPEKKPEKKPVKGKNVIPDTMLIVK